MSTSSHTLSFPTYNLEPLVAWSHIGMSFGHVFRKYFSCKNEALLAIFFFFSRQASFFSKPSIPSFPRQASFLSKNMFPLLDWGTRLAAEASFLSSHEAGNSIEKFIIESCMLIDIRYVWLGIYLYYFWDCMSVFTKYDHTTSLWAFIWFDRHRTLLEDRVIGIFIFLKLKNTPLHILSIGRILWETLYKESTIGRFKIKWTVSSLLSHYHS